MSSRIKISKIRRNLVKIQKGCADEVEKENKQNKKKKQQPKADPVCEKPASRLYGTVEEAE